jgi:excisionase family DNA binding protein
MKDNHPNPPAPLLTHKQVQTILNVSRSTIYNLIKDGNLPVIKIGKSARFRVEDVRKIIAGIGGDK